MNDRTQENGAVLGIAALAAGVVGTMVAALMSRESEQDARARLEGQLRQLDALSRTGRERTGKAMKKARKQAPKDVDRARQRASDLGSQVTGLAASGISTAKSRIDAGDLPGTSQRLATSLKERSREGASRAESAGSDVVSRASELFSEARGQVPNLKNRASQAAVDARIVGSNLGEQLRERLPEVRDQVEHRMTPVVRDLKRQAGPLIDDAAGVAATALSIAGTKAHDVREWAEKDALPEVRDTLGDVPQKVVEAAKNAEHMLANVSSDASGRLSDVGGTIEDRSRQVAMVATKGTKDTGSLLFWTTVAAGVVYYAFLSREQQAQVKAAGRRIGSEAREIYRDIQGYDEEFS